MILLPHYVLGVEAIFFRALACRENPIFLNQKGKEIPIELRNNIFIDMTLS